MTWSPRDQLRRVVMIERTGGDPDDDELYDYAADGKRLRKTTNRLVSGNVEKTETIYLDGCELRRVTQITPTPASTVILERWSSHAEGDDGRIATLYRWVTDTLGRETDDTSVINTHFHVASNIGSANVTAGSRRCWRARRGWRSARSRSVDSASSRTHSRLLT